MAWWKTLDNMTRIPDEQSNNACVQQNFNITKLIDQQACTLWVKYQFGSP